MKRDSVKGTQHSFKRGLTALALISGLAGTGSAYSASAGSGSAFGISADVEAASVAVITVAPTPGTSQSAPPDFDDAVSVASVNASAAGVASLSTGVLNASTDSSLGANLVNSAASVENLSLTLVPGISDVLSLSADSVLSSASATCSGGSVDLSGSTTLTNVVLEALGSGVAVSASPAPNTVIVNEPLTGLTVTLNEQYNDGSGNFVVNAIHIELNGLLTAAGVNADVVVAQSVVSMDDCDLPDLAAGKTGPASATVGVPFQYSLSVENTGNAPTTIGPGSITVSDVVPASLTIDNVAPGTDFSCGTAGQTVTCTRDSAIAAGAVATVATITVTPTAAGQVSNTAVAAGGGDNSPGNNTSPPVITTVGAPASPPGGGSGGTPTTTAANTVPVPALPFAGLILLVMGITGLAYRHRNQA